MSRGEEEAPRPTESGPESATLPALGDAPGPILSTDPLAVAGRKAMWIHVERLLAREPGLRDPERTDDLRKYRVATRRLRAAIRLFGEAYERTELQALEKGLRSVARAVGTVRDLDVRVADLERWATEREAEASGVAPLVESWRERRRSAAAKLADRLDGRRHARWLASLVAFVDVGGGEAPEDSGPAVERPRGAPQPSSVRDRAASRIWDAYERVRAFEPVVDGADVATLHALRIEVKRLRYGIEFLADVLGPDSGSLLEPLVALQDHLGALNDAVVAAAAVRAFLDHPDRPLSLGERMTIGAYLDDRAREIEERRSTVARPWGAVCRATFARRLGRLATVV